MNLSNRFLSAFAVLAVLAGVQAEKHTISLIDRCFVGTATLVQDGVVVSNGGDFTVNGAFSGVAFLQTIAGSCGPNGEGCTVVKVNLSNHHSSAVIQVDRPYAYTTPTSFSFTNGCDGKGGKVECDTETPETCHGTAAFCNADNVDLVVTFCG